VTGVSVIIPSRNRSPLLTTALRSVLWQREISLGVIVVDDCSSDDTGAVVTVVDDPRVMLLWHDRPLALSASRNHGAPEARGEWLALIEDDDLWAPNKLSSQLRAAAESGRICVYTGSVTVDDDLRMSQGSPHILRARFWRP
jgi:glycosyltransferase involved in cell wall biosynthesis